jgi:hypothetical protein
VTDHMEDSGATQAALAEQLRKDVGAVTWGLTALLGPCEELELVDQRVDARVAMWAATLLGDDDKLAAQTVVDLMAVLWPNCDPTTDWWRTPLGRAVARSVGHPTADAVSYSIAGAMLGCSKQYVGKLVQAGRLNRGPNGGVTSRSVRAALHAGTVAPAGGADQM